MRLTFLGTGSAIPSERVQSGLLLDDDALLFDCGSGVLHNLDRSSVAPDDVPAVFFTHAHVDHVNDLLPLVKADWLLGREELEIYGPVGIHDTIRGLFDVYDYMQGKVSIEIFEIEPGATFEAHGHRFETLATEHSITSMAYRVDDAFVYSGDTEAMDEMASFASGCDTVIHECSFPDSIEVGNHTKPSGLADAMEDCDARVLYITHLYPHTRGHEREMVETIATGFAGDVRLAEDMKTITVRV
jgi:ribonuclease BN (tRNA processing enzyme)